MIDHTVKVLSKSTAVADEFLVEIGRITAHFALLERDLIELTHKLMSIPENMARTVTAELSFRGLQQLAASLLKERLPAQSQAFEVILKRVSKCEEKRNAVAHSLWGAGLVKRDGHYTVVRTKFSAKQKKGLNFVRQEMTSQDLRAIAEEISVAAFDVEHFSSSIGRKAASPALQPDAPQAARR